VEENRIAWPTGGKMLTKCCNPGCEAPFDHREGRLIRFSRMLSSGQPAENQCLIEHLWLCGKCAELYVFEYESEINVKIKQRHQELSEAKSSSFVSAA
jgi:hypothetical protein